jgi:uncharacterized protein
MAEYFAEHSIMVLLSIDGLERTNDAYRVDKRGRGTFQQAMHSFQILKRYQGWVGVKMTVMPSNTPRLFSDVIGLYESGVNQFLIGHATGVKWKSDEMEAFGKQISRVAKWYAEHKNDELRITDFDNFDKDQPYFGCQAGRNNIVVSVTGELSSCSKVLAMNNRKLIAKLGDVWNGVTHIRNRFELVNCGKLKSACKRLCIDKSYQGGCFACNYEDTGDIFWPSETDHQFSLIRRLAFHS